MVTAWSHHGLLMVSSWPPHGLLGQGTGDLPAGRGPPPESHGRHATGGEGVTQVTRRTELFYVKHSKSHPQRTLKTLFHVKHPGPRPQGSPRTLFHVKHSEPHPQSCTRSDGAAITMV
jgi:hypothetical protein